MITGQFAIETLEPRKLLSTVTPGAQFPVGGYGAYASLFGRTAAADAGGNFVTIEGSDNLDVLVNLFDGSGNLRAGPILVDDPADMRTKFAPQVAMAGNGNFVVTWWQNEYDIATNIFGRLFDVSGAPITPIFRVTGDKQFKHTFPTAAMDADGDFMIVWNGETRRGEMDILAQRFNAAGAKLGKVFSVSTQSHVGQRHPSADMDAGGNAVVSWVSSGQDGSGDGIYAQRLRFDGAKAGGEFRVNAITAGDQNWPSLAATPDGRFAVAWQTFGQAVSEVYVRRFAADGTALGAETRANELPAATHGGRPSLDLGADGSAVVAWLQPDGVSSQKFVYAQAYDPTGAAIGSNFRADTTGRADYQHILAQPNGGFVIFWAKLDTGEQFGREFILA
jgi:hypothetical protein